MVKPHITKGAFGYYCADGRWCGFGETPAIAYSHWKYRNPEQSWVHNRPTPLQSRRHWQRGGLYVDITAV
jgi:hypothetical protein